MTKYESMTVQDQILVRSNQAPFRAFFSNFYEVDCRTQEQACHNTLRYIDRGGGTDHEKRMRWLEIDKAYLDWRDDGQTDDDSDPMIRVMMHLIEMNNTGGKRDAFQYMYEIIFSLIAVMTGPAFGVTEDKVKAMLVEAVDAVGDEETQKQLKAAARDRLN